MRFAKDTAFLLGRPLGPLYGGLMRLRAEAYRRGWLRSERVGVPVISVGNLTMGGTGKTPMVIEVVRLLQALGKRTAVVSRGYGGLARGAVNVVSDGQQILLEAAMAGDEPRLLAESLPGAVVVTGVRRVLAARYASEKLGAQVIVLDDGFQHLALYRDLDLVLFKGPDFLGNGRVFPGGDLREPFSALGRTAAFVLTNVAPPFSSSGASFRDLLTSTFPGRPIFSAPYCAGTLLPVNDLALGRDGGIGPCLAFCGLANPEAFRRSLAGKVELKGFVGFADHHPYAPADLDGLRKQAERLGARGLVTTAKDLVKIRKLNCSLPLYVLPIRLTLSDEFPVMLTGLF